MSNHVIRLPSGVIIPQPHEMLRSFCREEYPYYDAIPCFDANRIRPIDILATISMNSFVNNAKAVREVHKGMAERCDTLLERIPEDADLLTDDDAVKCFGELLHEAVQTPRVLVPVATKVLHRKRRNLIPMLDNVIIGHYLRASGRESLVAGTQDKKRAAGIAMLVLADFRDDLVAVADDIRELQQALFLEGFSLTLVRILELIVWMDEEPNGYYRSKAVA